MYSNKYNENSKTCFCISIDVEYVAVLLGGYLRWIIIPESFSSLHTSYSGKTVKIVKWRITGMSVVRHRFCLLWGNLLVSKCVVTQVRKQKNLFGKYLKRSRHKNQEKCEKIYMCPYLFFARFTLCILENCLWGHLYI